jgi:hypothetical protein
MAPIAGFNAKVRIGTAIFSCTRWSVRDTVADLDTTNTEGVTGSGTGAAPGFETRVAGPGVAEVTITNASFDPTENPFATPRNLAAGVYAAVTIFPDFGGSPSNFWSFPSLLITSAEQAGEAKGLTPITFTGRTDGFYSVPD